MKRCPTCTQLFDDSQSFCANDGTRLVNDEPTAPDFDPMATIMSPPPPSTTGEFNRPPSQNFSDPTPPTPSSWMDAPTPVPSMPASQPWSTGGMQPQQQGMPSYSGTQNQQNTLAIVSLVCGVLSILCFGLVTGIPAIITGYMQLNKIKSDPQTFGGRGLAIGGMATGAVGTLLTILTILIFMAGAIGGR
ncbi:MAG TPA: DUF4190 domain-containing protein [Pyrinomonadaceae bacterium]|jgi:hypothetical protein|nr:DUF4190 domain-containing protein [Pyrinomonadaceae bacterium]